MKTLRYFLRIVLFALLFLLALNNTAPASLILPLGVIYTLPQIVWFFLFFVLGALICFLAFLPKIWRFKSEIRRLTREKMDIFNQKTRTELLLKDELVKNSTVNAEIFSKTPTSQNEIAASSNL